MADGFGNRPRILRGAFVEYGLAVPPAMVVFQLNPVELARHRALRVSVPHGLVPGDGEDRLRRYHRSEGDLAKVRDAQTVTVAEETITLSVRLDATDALDEGDGMAQEFGVLPRLSTLELMVAPRGESLIASTIADALADRTGYRFTPAANPPLVLFVWGRKRVLPVNITGMDITETLFDTTLTPVRATVTVQMTAIEGPSLPARYTQLLAESISALNLANIADAAHVVVPG
jgi:Contractile injection system tube protein